MEYVGIDLHKKGFTVCAMDQSGIISHAGGYKNNINISELEKLLLEVKNPSFVIEATQNWMWMVRYFQKVNLPVALAHPLRTRAIASARIKTDELDAKTLAHLLRSDLVPMSYIPTIEEQEARDLARARCQMVKQKTWIKNQIHSLLTKENLIPEVSDLFGKKGNEWLLKQNLTDNNKVILRQFLEYLEDVRMKVSNFDKEIERKAKLNPKVDILKSIPGVGIITAYILVSEIGDPKRFPNGKKMAAYLGLVPSLYQSGNTKRLGSITKLGSPYARWMLVQTAHRMVRSDVNIRLSYEALAVRRGKKKAIIAVARKIVELSYRLLIDNRKYEVRMPKRD